MLTKYYPGDRIENNGMGGTYSTHGGGGEVYTGFWWGNLRERDHLEDSSLDGRIILKRIFMKCFGGTWTRSSWVRMGTGGGHL